MTAMQSRAGRKAAARRANILESLRQGHSRTLACAMTGIDRSTFYNWINADNDFRMDCEQAEALAECEMVASIVAAAKNQKSWQAAAWLLERRSAEWRMPSVRALMATIHKVEAALLQLSSEARAEFADHYATF